MLEVNKMYVNEALAIQQALMGDLVYRDPMNTKKKDKQPGELEQVIDSSPEKPPVPTKQETSLYLD